MNQLWILSLRALTRSTTRSENDTGDSHVVQDRRFWLALRGILIFFAAGVLMFALNSTSTMYEMVQNAYKVTLVGAFIPLVCGIYWHRATTQGALVSALGGLAVWVICERFFAEAVVPPQMWGLFAAMVGMLLGSFAPQLVRDARHEAFSRK